MKFVLPEGHTYLRRLPHARGTRSLPRGQGVSRLCPPALHAPVLWPAQRGDLVPARLPQRRAAQPGQALSPSGDRLPREGAHPCAAREVPAGALSPDAQCGRQLSAPRPSGAVSRRADRDSAPRHPRLPDQLGVSVDRLRARRHGCGRISRRAAADRRGDGAGRGRSRGLTARAERLPAQTDADSHQVVPFRLSGHLLRRGDLL